MEASRDQFVGHGWATKESKSTISTQDLRTMLVHAGSWIKEVDHGVSKEGQSPEPGGPG